jgi:adenylate cyclase
MVTMRLSRLLRLPSQLHIPIAARLAASIIIIVIIGLGTLAVVITGNQQRLIRSHIEEFGQLITYQLALTATEPMFTDQHYELAALIKRYVDSPRVLGAAIYDHEGRLTAAAGFYPTPQQLKTAGVIFDMNTAQMRAVTPQKIEKRAIVVVEPITFRNTKAGLAVLVLSQQALDAAQHEIVRISFFVALGLASIICIVAIYLGRRLAQPIHTLVDAARLLQRGEYTQIPERRNDEFGQIIGALNTMGQDLVRKAQVEDIMRRFLDRDIANKLLAEIEPVKVGGDRVQATVLFVDIAGFTSLSESMSPEAISDFLNDYFHFLDACARFYFGSIDKFIGDAMMVVFGAPRADTEHQYHALACAVLMQRLIGRINEIRATQNQPIAKLRIGVNSGEMLAGMVGSQTRMEYTVVGDAVNLASRLCNEAKAGQIIIEENLYHRLATNHVITVNEPRAISLRGKAEPITIYAVSDIDHTHPIIVDQMIDDMLHHRHFRAVS